MLTGSARFAHIAVSPIQTVICTFAPIDARKPTLTHSLLGKQLNHSALGTPRASRLLRNHTIRRQREANAERLALADLATRDMPPTPPHNTYTVLIAIFRYAGCKPVRI